MKLDTKNLKKIHSDKHSTTLSHSSGHKIMVAHGALSPAMRKQLDAIPHYSEGGYIEDRDRLHDADKSAKPKENPDNAVQPGYKSTPSTQGPRKTYDQALHDLKGYADGGEVDDMDTRTDSEKAIAAQLGQAQQAPPPASYEPTPDQMQQPAISQAPAAAIPQENATKELDQVAGTHHAALQNEAKAIGQQGQQEAGAADKQMKDMQALENEFNQKSDSILKERKSVMDDYQAGHIDPHHWWESKSTGGKIMTAIGLILGGLGASANGGKNVVLDLVNKQIDNDIDAQKTEMGKKTNMMTALTQQLGDVRQATMMNKVLKLDEFQASLSKAAAMSKDPIAKARAEQAMLQIRQQSALLHTQLAHSQAIQSGLQNGILQPEQAASSLVSKEMLPKTLETMGKVRSLDSMEQSSLQSFDHIAGLTGRGALSPNDARSAKQAFIGKLIKETEGRYNYEAAQNLADALFPNKSDGPKTVQNKRMRMNELFTSMRKEHESLLQGVGLPIPRQGQGFTPRGN